MAKVKTTVNIVDQVFPTIYRVASKEMATAARDIGLRLIKGKTRSGKQLEDGGDEGRQPGLSDSWKAKRARLATYNTTHEVFSPNRSNLSFSGQLVESLTAAIIIDPSSARVKFFVPATSRVPYRNKDGTPVSDTPDNKTLAGYLADMGRFFVGLDDKSRTQINNELTRILRRKLKALLR